MPSPRTPGSIADRPATTSPQHETTNPHDDPAKRHMSPWCQTKRCIVTISLRRSTRNNLIRIPHLLVHVSPVLPYMMCRNNLESRNSRRATKHCPCQVSQSFATRDIDRITTTGLTSEIMDFPRWSFDQRKHLHTV